MNTINQIKIYSNKARCKKCGDILESLYRRDFRTCKCGSISIDGGFDYLKRLGDVNNIEELSELKNE